MIKLRWTGVERLFLGYMLMLSITENRYCGIIEFPWDEILRINNLFFALA
jgi:hypothetical protein